MECHHLATVIPIVPHSVIGPPPTLYSLLALPTLMLTLTQHYEYTSSYQYTNNTITVLLFFIRCNLE